MSSAISAASLSRSSWARVDSSCSRCLISVAIVRWISSESATSKSRGPSSLTSSKWMRFLISANGSRPSPRDSQGSFASRSCSSISAALPQEAAPAPADVFASSRKLHIWRRGFPQCHVPFGEGSERASGARPRLGNDDRTTMSGRPRDRDIAGHEEIGFPPEQTLHIVSADPDISVGPVEHECDLCGISAHLLECLEADLRVLQGQRIERSDHAQVRRGVDSCDHLRRERRRRIGDDKVVSATKNVEQLMHERDGDRGSLIGPDRREKRIDPGLVGDDERVDLVSVERSRRAREIVDRLRRLEAERKAYVPELEVEVDQDRTHALLRECDSEIAR